MTWSSGRDGLRVRQKLAEDLSWSARHISKPTGCWATSFAGQWAAFASSAGKHTPRCTMGGVSVAV